MAKIDFPKKQEQRLIPKYLLEYSEELQKNHPDPSAEWGSSGTEYTAGTGINITDNTISIDNTVETKANATNRFVSKANLTDYSINHIIVGNSEIDNDNFDLRAVYSQDVKSEISADPTSIIARTMSGTDVSTIGVSATEIDLTTSMLKYNAHEVATKNDIPDVSEFITDDDLSQALEDYELKSEAFSGSYNDLTDKPTIPTKTSDLQNDSGFITGITSNMITSALGYTPGTSNFSGDYDDLTDKPTIPVVPTNVSAFTNDAGYITSSALPTNYVTTDTTQTITGQKTFTGDVYITGSKLLKLKPTTNYQGSFTGFTAYDTSNNEYGNLQIGKRSINFGSGASDRIIVSLGNYSTHYTGTNKPLVGFRAQDQSNTSINFVMPTTNFSTNFTGADTFYMPMMVNGTKANSDGNITLAIPDVSNYYTKTEIDNMIGDIETLLAAI